MLKINSSCKSAFETSYDVTSGCLSTQVFPMRMLMNSVQSQSNSKVKNCFLFKDYKRNIRKRDKCRYAPPLSKHNLNTHSF